MTTIHFRVNRRFWLSRALGAIIMAVVCLLFVRYGLQSAVGWFGIVGALFFGIGAAVGLKEGTRRGPRLTLDDEGIHDRSLRVGVIAWSDIIGIEPYGVAGQPFIGLCLRDPSKYLARASGMGLLLARLNAGSGFPLSVNLVGLKADPLQVVDMIETGCGLYAQPPE
jgi:hypothetical protein